VTVRYAGREVTVRRVAYLLELYRDAQSPEYKILLYSVGCIVLLKLFR
jgi:hypothetical protein